MTAGGGGRSFPRRLPPVDPGPPAQRADRAKAQAAARATAAGPPPGFAPADPAPTSKPQPSPAPTPAPRPQPAGKPPAQPQSISLPTPSLDPGDGAGFILGLVIWALVNSYIRYGPAGPKTWLAAKFLNQQGNLTTK